MLGDDGHEVVVHPGAHRVAHGALFLGQEPVDVVKVDALEFRCHGTLEGDVRNPGAPPRGPNATPPAPPAGSPCSGPQPARVWRMPAYPTRGTSRARPPSGKSSPAPPTARS